MRLPLSLTALGLLAALAHVLPTTGKVYAQAPPPAPSPAAVETAKPPDPGSGAAVPEAKARPVRVSRFEEPPVIDGKLDEEVWKNAAVFKDFYQISPGDNTAPSLPTKAR